MAERNVEAKLKKQLKQDKIQLWKVPYSDDAQQPGRAHMQELAERYAALLRLPGSEVAEALEVIRVGALKRGERNQTFRESGVATVELLLPPRDGGKKSKMSMETRLDVCAQELMDRIAEEVGLASFKVILNGRTLNAGQRLDQQGVGNHSRMMVLKAFDAASAPADVGRAHRGFRILSERDGSDDLQDAPFLEVADQKGTPLKIPQREKKALILAMGLHEKGRALMKRKRHDDALCHLLQADVHFSECGSALLGVVDNHGVLQLDIVWCYQASEALSCLDDGRQRLRLAEDCFVRCYGERRQRLLVIKGNTGQEDVLFLRLRLLQSLLAFVDGDDLQARQRLEQVESLYARLSPDADKMTQLMVLGFSEREARLGLRASRGDVQEAASLVGRRRREREELRRRERQKRKKNKESLAVLAEAGYGARDAAAALRRANGDLERAFQILLDASQAPPTCEANLDQKLQQLLYLGFERSAAEAALASTGGDLQSATELLIDNWGAGPSEAAPPSEDEEPGTSSGSADDSELVNEVLEDIPGDEDDYLDPTLEEELQLLNAIKTHLARSPDQ
ncbi:NEDD8 ultimate buster 1 isoform X3 [Syngnathoides biaculeatus]|uniref:NEDD8 ultimate buster 1 isoform X3 n=1 Tax=Syngnathoides biaculeatus TaxID=300417 RepID=UPI002ADD925A|nr:NEDD8 ultimate buster 1 isoform X3 [Syngnathoides biaculeatus]